MNHYQTLLVFAVLAFVGFDLVRTLQTGRARGRFGTITRAKRPERYWRYVYASCAFLVIMVVMLFRTML